MYNLTVTERHELYKKALQSYHTRTAPYYNYLCNWLFYIHTGCIPYSNNFDRDCFIDSLVEFNLFIPMDHLTSWRKQALCILDTDHDYEKLVKLRETILMFCIEMTKP